MGSLVLGLIVVLVPRPLTLRATVTVQAFACGSHRKLPSGCDSQRLKAGDLLFRVDPEPYDAQTG